MSDLEFWLKVVMSGHKMIHCIQKWKILYELSLANFNKSIKQSSNYVLQDFSLLY